MYKLLDVTFLIPIRMDSVIRIENISASINYLLNNFNTNIIVLEAGKYCNNILRRLLPENVKYIFRKDGDPVFYRTFYLNYMTSISQTDIVAIWDADIIIPANQILKCVKKLRSHNSDIVLPYDGRFLDTTSIIRDLFIELNDVNILTNNMNKMLFIYGQGMCGGAILVNRNKYIESGMENLDFYGWGPEDQERMIRWEKLGFRIERINGVLFHLTHPRDINGRYNSYNQKRNLIYKLELTKAMRSKH